MWVTDLIIAFISGCFLAIFFGWLGFIAPFLVWAVEWWLEE